MKTIVFFKILKIILITFVLILYSEVSFSKSRVIILTDIANEPDDAQSMVRFLVYSNEFDVEGLIATTGCWLKEKPKTSELIDIVKEYGKVRDNLALHSDGYLTGEQMLNMVKEGNHGYSMMAVGNGKNSAGSDHIIQVLEKVDDRPVWVCIWGGANTLAQALWDIKKTKSNEETENIIAKLRVYDLAGQDDAGAWMCHTFPKLFYIRSITQWVGISHRVDGKKEPNQHGGDTSLFSHKWVDENVQFNHGVLGKMYPNAEYRHEGDSPTFLYLIPNGLSNPEHPEYGSWGGRFCNHKTKNPRAKNLRVELENEYDDYYMYTDAKGYWQYNSDSYFNINVPVFRWKEDFQNDFAARMDWCIMDYKSANHNPVAVVNGDFTKNVIEIKAKHNEEIELNASASFDNDGDDLLYNWWIYPEVTDFFNLFFIKESNKPVAKIKIPKSPQGSFTIHIILTLRDTGNPQLTSYRRILLKIEE